VLQIHLPESVRFLAGKKRYHRAIRQIEKIEEIAGFHPAPWKPEDFMQPHIASGAGFKELFRSGFKTMTFLIWATYLFSMVALYGLSTWLPSILANAGFSLVKSYSFGIVQSLGAAAGGFLLGCLMDSFGRKPGLCLSYLLGGLSVLWFGSVTSDLSLYCAGAATGIFLVGIPAALHVVAAEIYPTHIRSTGAGWAYAVGRLGSIAGPIMGGVVQMAGFTFLQFFVVFSLPCFVCVLLVALYPVGVRKESLETVTVKLLKLEK
jgi:AAHS family benzoate transporter-like MFS transporter